MRNSDKWVTGTVTIRYGGFFSRRYQKQVRSMLDDYAIHHGYELSWTTNKHGWFDQTDHYRLSIPEKDAPAVKAAMAALVTEVERVARDTQN